MLYIRMSADERAVVDVGCAKLMIEGKVKVKSGVEVAELTETGVVFTDGSSHDCDSIILA